MAMLEGNWQMLIDGERVDSKKRREVLSPATGEPIATVPEATTADVDRALAAARAAQPAWGALAPIDRAKVMRRIADLIRRDAEQLARIVVERTGQADQRGARRGRWSGRVLQLLRRIRPPHRGRDSALRRRRRADLDPARAGRRRRRHHPVELSGGARVAEGRAGDDRRQHHRPQAARDDAAFRPLHGRPLRRGGRAAKGVVNIVTGAGESVGERLVNAAGVDLITMTGSVPTGKRIMSAAAQSLTPVSLELGGKAPFIVMRGRRPRSRGAGAPSPRAS